MQSKVSCLLRKMARINNLWNVIKVVSDFTIFPSLDYFEFNKMKTFFLNLRPEITKAKVDNAFNSCILF